jgi:O-antigen/teichoic acid export membrane protein
LIKASEDVALSAVIWSLSYFIGSILLYLFIFPRIGLRYKPIFNFTSWVHHIRQSIYFTMAGLLMTLYQYLPILFLTIYFGTYEVGIFSASYRIVSTICSVGFFLPMAFYPIISELYFKDRQAFLKSNIIMQGLMLTAGIIICLVGMLYGNEILLWLFGPNYTASIKIFKILIWLVVIIFMRYSLGISIIASDRQKLHMFTCGAAFFLGLILSLILVPKHSTTGAAVTILVTELFYLSLEIVIYYKIFLLRRHHS